jgi:demethylmenaquinone methyltransferase / 2-methoxy-6-polyprenyl-1,4-benzoquinol methylase
MHTFVPLMGSLLTGQRDAYTYLPDTTDHFLSAEELAGKMRAAGFKQIAFRRRMFGTVAIHSAEKGKTA